MNIIRFVGDMAIANPHHWFAGFTST
jgi:hypothetical protein